MQPPSEQIRICMTHHCRSGSERCLFDNEVSEAWETGLEFCAKLLNNLILIKSTQQSNNNNKRIQFI